MELKLEPLKNGCYLLMLVSLSSQDCGTQTRQSLLPAVVLAAHSTKRILSVGKLQTGFSYCSGEGTVAAGGRSVAGVMTPLGPGGRQDKARLFLFSLAAMMAETSTEPAGRAELQSAGNSAAEQRRGASP